jgi:hypothetical protein
MKNIIHDVSNCIDFVFFETEVVFFFPETRGQRDPTTKKNAA